MSSEHYMSSPLVEIIKNLLKVTCLCISYKAGRIRKPNPRIFGSDEEDAPVTPKPRKIAKISNTVSKHDMASFTSDWRSGLDQRRASNFEPYTGIFWAQALKACFSSELCPFCFYEQSKIFQPMEGQRSVGIALLCVLQMQHLWCEHGKCCLCHSCLFSYSNVILRLFMFLNVQDYMHNDVGYSECGLLLWNKVDTYLHTSVLEAAF